VVVGRGGQPWWWVGWRRFFWYFALPTGVTGILAAMYFSGVPVLQAFVAAPDIEGISLYSRREFGALEMLQNAVLLGVVIVAVLSVFRHPDKTVRGMMVAVALGATFLLLEEMDYGMHIYRWWSRAPADEMARVNLHNKGRLTHYIKAVGTGGAVALFIVAPFVLRTSTNRWVRYIVPHWSLGLVLLSALLIRSAVHELAGRGLGRGLENNLSEFREVLMYYLGLAYTVVLSRRVPGDAGGESAG